MLGSISSLMSFRTTSLHEIRDSPQLDPNGVINLPKAFLYYLLQQSEARS